MEINYPPMTEGLKVRHRETLEERTVQHADSDCIWFVEPDYIAPDPTEFWSYFEPFPQPGDHVRVVRSENATHANCIGREGILRGPTGDGDYFIDGWYHYGPLSDFEVILTEAPRGDLGAFAAGADDPANYLPGADEALMGAPIVEMVGGPAPADFIDPEPGRCAVCLGPAGDDTRRCELMAGHLEAWHLVAGKRHFDETPAEPETVSVPVELLKHLLPSRESDDDYHEGLVRALLPKPKPKWVMVQVHEGMDEWYTNESDAFDVIDTAIDQTPLNIDFKRNVKAAVRKAFEGGADK